MRKLLLVIILGILLIPNINAQDLPEVEILTWDPELVSGVSFQWNVNKFAYNGTTITDATEYGIAEGSLISLTIDSQLSDFNVAYLLENSSELPDVNEYVTIAVDGSQSNITVFHPGILILPTNLTLVGGSYINALFAASLYEQVFLSEQNRYDQATCEYKEFNSTVLEEEFIWDVFLGVLKSVKIHWEEDLELDVSVVNPEQFCVAPTESSTPSPIESPSRKSKDSPLDLSGAFIAFAFLPLIHRKFKKSHKYSS